eukprot:scaffold94675_cov45-Phaeocystis_antarctica.AAC.1
MVESGGVISATLGRPRSPHCSLPEGPERLGSCARPECVAQPCPQRVGPHRAKAVSCGTPKASRQAAL